MTKSASKRCALKASCLCRIPSRRKLAHILLVAPSFIEALAKFEKPYHEFELNGRWTQDPKAGLKQVQKRFAFLLAQIETPDYLHSAVKKRSYITNSQGHTARYRTAKLDVKKFYPSARAAQVDAFFREVLEWPSDLAGLMTRLLTYKGYLPTGGNASPILSFWAYKPMFDELAALAEERGCLFSLYVDDMTLTGELASRSLLYEARGVVGSYRLRAHKTHLFGAGQARIVTGVANTPEGPRLPLRRQLLIAKAETTLREAETDEERVAAFRPLVGRICEAVEVDPFTWRPRAERLLGELKEFTSRREKECLREWRQCCLTGPRPAAAVGGEAIS